MSTKKLDKEIKKKLKTFEEKYFVYPQYVSTIDQSLARLEERAKLAEKYSTDKPNEFISKMLAYSNNNFYLIEYLYYWQNINVSKLNDMKLHPEGDLKKMITGLEEIIKIQDEMIKQCKSGKIPNIKLNNFAEKEVIGRLPCELYKVDDSIKISWNKSNPLKNDSMKEKIKQLFVMMWRYIRNKLTISKKEKVIITKISSNEETKANVLLQDKKNFYVQNL
jgi:hypothetical protein